MNGANLCLSNLFLCVLSTKKNKGQNTKAKQTRCLLVIKLHVATYQVMSGNCSRIHNDFRSKAEKKEESEKEYRTLDCHLPTLEVLN
jgi:hypothetical protein